MPRIGRSSRPQAIDAAGAILGPYKPRFDPQPPPQPVETTILVVNQAVTPRRNMAKWFPLQGWEGGDIKQSRVLSEARAGTPQVGNAFTINGASGTNEKCAESFVPSLSLVNPIVSYRATKFGSPTDNLVFSIQTDAAGQPSGTVLWTASISSASPPAFNPGNRDSEYSFQSSVTLNAGTKYWAVWERDGARDAVNTPAIVVTTFTGRGMRLDSGVWTQTANTEPYVLLQVAIVDQALGVPRRFLGPKPPEAMRALPTSEMTTLRQAQNLALRDRRSYPKRFPLQEWSHAAVSSPTFTTALVLQHRSLGLAPPLIVLPLPSAQQTTITVYGRAASRRSVSVRLFPLQGWRTQNIEVGRTLIPILDDFQRPNENPLTGGGNWAQADAGANPLRLLTGVVRPSNVGAAYSYWTRDVFTDCEASIDLKLVVQNYVMARLSNVGTANWSGYVAQSIDQNNSKLFRVDNGAFTQLGATVTHPLSASSTDRLGIRCVGDQISLYRIYCTGSGSRLDGVWNNILTVTDSTYSSGYAGLGGEGNTSQDDNFRARAYDGSPFGYVAYPVLGTIAPHLGVRPPLLIDAMVSQELQTIQQATRAAVTPRLEMAKRFPLQGWEGAEISETGGTETFGCSSRNLGVFPPMIIDPAVAVVTFISAPIEVKLLAIAERVAAQQRQPHQHLFPPQVLAQPPPFFGPQVALLPVDRIGRRQRRHNLTSFLTPPSVIEASLQPPDGRLAISVTLARTMPPGTRHILGAPVTLQTFDGPSVSLTRAFPPLTTSFLSPPTVLQTFSGDLLATASARPPATHSFLRQPTVVRVPNIEQHQQTISVVLVRIRPRQTTSRLFAPATLQEFFGPVETQVAVRTFIEQRRHSPHSRLAPPTVVRVPSVEQQEQTIRVFLTRSRPKPTTKFIYGPIVLQIFDGPFVSLTRIRPQPTSINLLPPTVLAAAAIFSGPTIFSTAIARSQRPVPTMGQVGSPLIINPLPAQTQQTIQTNLTANNNRLHGARGPHSHLSSLTIIQTFVGPRVFLVRIKPRPTTKYLEQPTVVRVPSVEQAEATIRVSLARIRPRPISSRINPPPVLQVFAGPFVSLARIKPRPTSKVIFAPTILLVPSVEARLRTIEVTLAHIRPRPTTNDLRPPTVIIVNPPVVTTISVNDAALRTRTEQKRHFPLQGFRQRLVRETGSTTTFQQFDPFLGPRPPQIIDPLPTQREQTIKTTLAAARTRLEQKRHYPLPGFGQQIIRETGAAGSINQVGFKPSLGVHPPTIIGGLPTGDQTALNVNFLAFKRRNREKRYFPLQGFTGQLIRETGQSGSVIQSAFKPLLGIRPPTVIGPLPNDEQQTIGIKTVAVRTTVEQRRHEPRSVLSPPAVVAAAPPSQDQQTLHVELVAARTAIEQIRHAPRSKQINPVTYPAASTISVTNVSVQTRIGLQRRAAHYFLSSISYQATSEISVTSVAQSTRSDLGRRASHWFLAEPTVVRIPSIEQQQQTIRIATVQIRPRPTSKQLSEPTVLQTFSGPTVALTNARPRPTTYKLFAPTELQIFIRPVESLVRIRPFPTTKHIQPPVALQTFNGPTVSLARIRPRPTTKTLGLPQVVNYNPVDLTILVSLAGRTRIEQQRRGTHFRLTSISYQATSNIRVSLTQARPRATTTFLNPPTSVHVFQARTTVVSLVKNRPRPTSKFLGKPTVVSVPSVEQRQQTILVALTRTRPQPTLANIYAPAFTPPLVTQLFGAQTQIRPFPTTRQLHVPTAVHRFQISRGTVVTTTSDSAYEAGRGGGSVTARIGSKLISSQKSGSSVEIGIEEGTVDHE